VAAETPGIRQKGRGRPFEAAPSGFLPSACSPAKVSAALMHVDDVVEGVY